MDRRSFLKLLGAAPLVIAAPSLAEIWIPPQQEIIIPPELTETIVEGNTVCGWVVPFDMAEDVYDMLNDHDAPHMRQQFGTDAIMYFPKKTPILLLTGNVNFDNRIYNPNSAHLLGKKQRINQRFRWHGAGKMPEGGTQFRILQSWNDSSQMVLQ